VADGLGFLSAVHVSQLHVIDWGRTKVTHTFYLV